EHTPNDLPVNSEDGMCGAAFLKNARTHLESVLPAFLPPPSDDRVAEAIHYSVVGGGKRLRPLLVYATGDLFGVSPRQLDPLAVALELIHCYSLIHDDLPAMDDSALRRGRPSCHIQYGEATAILAGDALQSIAFGLLPRLTQTLPNNGLLADLLAELSQVCGLEGLIRGQSMDLQLAGDAPATEENVQQMHWLKTGALICACVSMAAKVCNAKPESPVFCQLVRFAEAFGLAFQAKDDLLDATGKQEVLGKQVGQDLAAGKHNIISLIGIEATRVRIEQLIQQAESALAVLPQEHAAPEALRTLLLTLKAA
ncbi:MAG: polyprenyl synthetase family protein, partial [Gammaproteobacteria bacterium]